MESTLSPWRFVPGDTVYVRDFIRDIPLIVEKQVASKDLRSFVKLTGSVESIVDAGLQTVPHYILKDSAAGTTYLTSQLLMSTKPLYSKK